MKLITMLFAYVFLVGSAFGQSIYMKDVDATNFPTIKAKFYAFDKNGNMLRPSASELAITENGTPRTITNVSCPTPQPPKALSSVLVIDVSGSMEGWNINLAKTAALSWVGGLPLGKSECAISSFNKTNYLNQDFTTDKNKLTTAINNLNADGGTSYDAAFINSLSGGLLISKQGKHKKVLVMITDGVANNPKTQEIINEANKQNCIIYCVTLGLPAPQSLYEIAKQTGGQVFENVTTEQEAVAVYNIILHTEQGNEPCTIEWQSNIICFSGIKEIELQSIAHNITYKSNYQIPDNSIAKLEFAPTLMRFENPPIGTTVSQTLTITARNAPFTVSNITSSNPVFNINPTSFTIQPNQSQDIIITYNAQDSGFTFARLTFENDLCVQTYFVTGGYKGKRPTVKTLKLTHPNGSEKFVVGSDTVITWEGIPPTELIQLEYSTDNGTNWKYIDTTRGLSYNWKTLPSPVSQQCLIRINQLKGNETYSVRTLKAHSHYVFSVAFSPDGNLLASSSNDTVKIWDVYSGQLIHSLTSNSNLGFVRSVAFSSDGKLLASACDDNTIIIWDASTGNLFNILTGHKNRVESVAFSPDNNILISGSGRFEETIKLWDANDGKLIRNLTENSETVDCVAFSPDGITLASGIYNNINLWDASSGQLIRTLAGHNSRVNSVAFSPDGNTIASGSLDGFIKLWNTTTGQLVNTLAFLPLYQVLSVSFSLDGKTLASGDADKIYTSDYTVKLWDVSAGQLIRTLPGHSNFVSSVSFSPDGNTLASGSGDSTIKLWDLNIPSLQQDQSDAVFSIVAPSVNSVVVDMGKVLVNSSKDSVVAEFVVNTGSYPCRIDSIYFRGADATSFFLVSGVPEYTVSVGGSHHAEFSFTPSKVGVHNAEIVIITQADTLIQNITGIGVEPNIQVLKDFIDFGKVKVGTEKDSLQVGTIKNIGNAPLMLTKIYQDGPNFSDFSEINNLQSKELQPNDELKLDLRFKPSDIGRTSGTLLFEYNGVGSPAVVQLFGEGTSNGNTGDKGIATLKLDSIQTKTSTLVEYPVTLTLDSNAQKSGANSANYEIEYNNTLLAPLEYYPLTNESGKAVLKFTNVAITADPIQILQTLRFTTGLGNAIETPLTINNFELVGTTEEVDVILIDGHLFLTDVCYEGGVRLLNPNSTLVALSLHPNPSNGNINIEFNLIEKGETELFVLDNQGKVVYSNKFISEPGKSSIELATDKFANGIYSVILQTPTIKESQQILIVK